MGNFVDECGFVPNFPPINSAGNDIGEFALRHNAMTAAMPKTQGIINNVAAGMRREVHERFSLSSLRTSVRNFKLRF